MNYNDFLGLLINIFYYYHKICYYKLYIKKWGFCYEL
nr:MAG TPA: hypothetical protein [Caudoviricetes sp.]